MSSSENGQSFKQALGSKGSSGLSLGQVDSNFNEHLEKMRQSRAKINEMLQDLGQKTLPDIDKNADQMEDVKMDESFHIDKHQEKMQETRDKINSFRRQMGLPPIPDRDMTIDQMKEFTSSMGPGDLKLDSMSSSDEQVTMGMICLL